MAETRKQDSPQNENEQTAMDREARLRREAVAEQIAQNNRRRMAMERGLDETLADSFPASDPPSSIPDPSEGETYAA
jgi:hypothetical protein